MNIGRRLSISYIVLTLIFFVAPFVDLTTGYFIYHNSSFLLSPSIFFRCIIIILLLIYLKKIRFPIILISILFIDISNFFFYSKVPTLFFSIVFISKLIYFYLLLIFFHRCAIINKFLVVNFLKYSSLLISAILILSFTFDIGEPTYSYGDFGIKSYFPSGNALGFFLGVSICLFCIIKSYCKDFYFPFFFYVIILVGNLLVFTKTSIVLSLFSFLIYSSFIIKLFFSIFFLNLIPYIINYLSLPITFIKKQLEYWDNSVFNLFFGNRLYNLSTMVDFDFWNNSLFSIFLGNGFYIAHQNPNIISHQTLETDLFDFYFSYGILGIIILFHILSKVLTFTHFNTFLLSLLICFHIVWVGHSLLNGMSVIIILSFISSLKILKSNNNASCC